jgi:hypothetical protein
VESSNLCLSLLRMYTKACTLMSSFSSYSPLLRWLVVSRSQCWTIFHCFWVLNMYALDRPHYFSCLHHIPRVHACFGYLIDAFWVKKPFMITIGRKYYWCLFSKLRTVHHCIWINNRSSNFVFLYSMDNISGIIYV